MRPHPLALYPSLAAALLALAALWHLAGTAPFAGALLGAASGGALTSAGFAWQRLLARRGSRLWMQAFGAAFLVKLSVLLGGTLALRFASPLAALFDWRAFAIAFPAAVLWASALLSPGAARALAREGAR